MDKHSLIKRWLKGSILFFLAFVLFLSQPVLADIDSSLYIKITDATTAVEDGDQTTAKNLVAEIKTSFEAMDNHDSKAGKKVSQALTIKGKVTKKQLTAISAALLAFDKEQNPVDASAEKQRLVKNLSSDFDHLQTAISAKDLTATRTAFKSLNSTWTANESIVRDQSTAYYGSIETAISFLRSAIETEPTDFADIQTAFDDLKTEIDNFVQGKAASTVSSNLTLKDGIKLLQKALNQFKAGDTSKAKANMKQFITIWPTIEGEVSTRDSALYTRVESQTPVIMVKGNQKSYQKQLETLISDLSTIDTSANYGAFDVMLILLREGIEALLIIMALVTTLKASRMQKGLRWVYAGALLGILASLAIAVVLQSSVSSAVSSGTSREIIEGFVGLFAVVMMIFIGIWLHGKSTTKKWQAFMDKQIKAVAATGSFVSMFGLSFLAVFREGAETILFYAGIYPRTDSLQFYGGIALAIAALVILAFIMTKASNHIQPQKIFFWLTWLIYALAFKMLGVSIHALQLTNIAPNHLINGFPTIDFVGIYPNLEGLSAQLVFVGVIALVTYKNWRDNHG